MTKPNKINIKNIISIECNNIIMQNALESRRFPLTNLTFPQWQNFLSFSLIFIKECYIICL